MHYIIDFLKHALETWGYWAVLVALLCENAGVPLPGETILLFASFLAYKGERLQIQWIIVIGIVACTIGDNIGYWIGHRGGRPLLEHWKKFFRITHEDIVKGEQFLTRHGWSAIFIARFIAGMRIVAGPMAGILRMPWKQFVSANFCGAAVWVSTIALVGYTFGSKSDELMGFLDRVNNFVLIAIVVAVVGWWFWRKRKKSRERTARPAVSDTMK